MKINLKTLGEFLIKFGLVIVVSFTDDFSDFPKDFPYQIWIERKSHYDKRTEK